ncbi:MAG: acetyl-CoA C-acyltransferase [Acidobacteria bacterium]|nr:MAG: acetyl-CoA C-acyltransferase [Acidobacteriota bacterium]
MPSAAVILAGARTPFVKAWGAFRRIPARELGRMAASEALARSTVDPAEIDEVIFGNIAQPADATNIARVVALRSNIPRSVPAYTVNRNCASGIQAVVDASLRIESGQADLILAGGVESMSQIPLLYLPETQDLFLKAMRARSFSQRVGAFLKLRPRHFKPVVALEVGLTDPVAGLNMGETAEVLAKRYQVTRDEQDSWALESHRRVAKATASGRFREEIAPVFLPPRYEESVGDDIGYRAEQTLEALAKLKPVFDRRYGTVTAGNSSQITDGAAALVLASEERARSEGYPILGRVRSWAFAGCDPAAMGMGPAYATPLALRRGGAEFRDVKLIEINEAFAAQVIACERAFASREFAQKEVGWSHPIGEMDRAVTNVNGGAIALGHPVGCTGARLVLTLCLEMNRRGKDLGLATLCVGGGQGAAILIEKAS